MFKRSANEVQTDLFSSPQLMMKNRDLTKYNSSKHWHNQFYENVTKLINEEVFRPLFIEGNMGAPNASIRIMVAMSVIKEGLGISDDMLFELCTFNLLFRKALGVLNLSDDIPSIDTYYLFRRRLCKYEQKTGQDLMESCMSDVTKSYITDLNISGHHVRMDSKLLGSNIAWYSRYELIHKIFCKYVEACIPSLNPSLRKTVETIMKRDVQDECYRADSSTIKERICELGHTIQKIVAKIKAPADHILRRILNEQFILGGGKAEPKDNKDISANSIQSPYDFDAAYRCKGDQTVKGYSINLTETVDADKPSIVTSVQVEPATTGDNSYLQEAVSKTEALTGGDITNIYADGAYQSEDNRQFCGDRIKLCTCGIQGRKGRFEYTTENDEIHVTDKSTNYKTVVMKMSKGYKFIDINGKTHYITQKVIDMCKLKKELSSTPPEELNKRNNVEAAMFQLSFHTRNGKTRYRGLMKQKLFAYARVMWINFRRLCLYYEKSINQRTLAMV